MMEQQASTRPCDWKHLPAVAVQAIGQHCCPASKAQLRLTCSAWHQALANQFSTLYIGPGDPAWQHASTSAHVSTASHASTGQHQQQRMHVPAWVLGEWLHKAFPAVSSLQLTASSSREYEETFTQDLAQLLATQRRLTQLTLYEVHELEELDTLDPASLWDVLAAALPVLAGRLQVLHVSGCFWNQPELFEGLRQLTAVTELRLANTPLETAYELRVVASMTQLVQLELGIIFDGSSQHHDVPRALESLGDLQKLQALSIPMWRRSLGGRAHPLAPALSAALQRLTGLTNLAVDGKFSYLAVVSGLINLRQLASAAPLSQEGWQAICQLPHLTLLTSLTPPLEALQINPQRPHPGCDLARLTPKASLAGMDITVLQPQHLATIGQFTALRQLNLRCASTFHNPQQQAQLLTAMACLPSGLTSLSMGPLLPLSAQLFSNIASSCSGLKVLHASFTHTAPAAAAVTAAAAAVAMPALAARMLAAGVLLGSSQGSNPTDLTILGGRAPDAQQQQQQQGQGMELDIEQWQSPVQLGPTNSSRGSSSISQALGALQQLRELELVLLSDTDRSESPTLAAATAAARRSSSYGGALMNSPPNQAAAGAAGVGAGAAGAAAFVPPAAAAAAAAAGASGTASGWSRGLPPAAAASSSGGGFGGHAGSSSNRGAGKYVQLHLQQLPRPLKHLRLSGNWQLCYERPVSIEADGDNMQPVKALCKVCQRKAAAAAVAAAAADGVDAMSTGVDAVPDSSLADALCECIQGLRLVGTSVPQQQQQQQQAPGWPDARTQRVSNSSSTGSGSPTRSAAVTGLKRPASYPTVQHVVGVDGTAGTVAAATATATAGGGSPVVDTGAAVYSFGGVQQQQQAAGVFLFEQQQALQKRSRSFGSMQAAGVSTAAAQAGTGPAEQPQQQQQQQQQQRVLPQLAELSLFRVQVLYEALSALVQASRVHLSKLELLQLSVRDTQQQQRGGFLATQQLLALPVAWGSLQELHIHPYQLWGMLTAGCMTQRGHTFAAAAAAAAAQQPPSQDSPAAAVSEPLQHVQQLLSLRHLYVVNVPVSFESATPPNPITPPGLASRIPTVGLPLYHLDAEQRMAELLTALQVGLQQLPALRQLLLYMGPATGVPASAEGGDYGDMDAVWMESSEALLRALPAVRVRQFRPSTPHHSSMCSVEEVYVPDPPTGLMQGVEGQERMADGLSGEPAAAKGRQRSDQEQQQEQQQPQQQQASSNTAYDSMEPEYMI